MKKTTNNGGNNMTRKVSGAIVAKNGNAISILALGLTLFAGTAIAEGACSFLKYRSKCKAFAKAVDAGMDAETLKNLFS